MKLIRRFTKKQQNWARIRRNGLGAGLRGEILESRQMMTVAVGDFNGDGIHDAAHGLPGEDVGAIVDAGAVNIIYGNSGYSGLASPGNQIWHQDSPGIRGVAESYDRFGSSLAVGDFNGDGYDDLAIGVSEENLGSISNAGAVNVIYGSANGLHASAGAQNQIWTQDSNGILGVAEASDGFGRELAAGDFNGDGRDDLAIGVSGEDDGRIFNAGAVNVIYGRSSTVGLTAGGNQLWHQDSAGIVGVSESGDAFGSSLTTGDFNGDGKDDLAIGVAYEDLGGSRDAGAVNVIYGRYSYSGLNAHGNQVWTQDTTGITGVAEAGDQFGISLAAGDFNGDGRDDLAIGVSGEDHNNVRDSGAVNVIYGRSSNTGLASAGNQIWHQGSAGIAGAINQGDRFGFSLTTGDFNNDGKDDLAVGVPDEDVGGRSNAGAVNVIYGRFAYSGLNALNDQIWTQDSSGMLGTAHAGDQFGIELASGDFNGDGKSDLAVDIVCEQIASVPSGVPALQVIYGRSSNTGLSSAGDQIWHQGSPGILGAAEASDKRLYIVEAQGTDDQVPHVAIEDSIDDANDTHHCCNENECTGPVDDLTVCVDTDSIKVHCYEDDEGQQSVCEPVT